jgi:DUF1680 family protein
LSIINKSKVDTVMGNFFRKISVLLLSTTISMGAVFGQSMNVLKVPLSDHYIDPSSVKVGGELGSAIEISEHGRLRELPSWNDSALIKMFTEEARNNNKKQDWYGEHAGKWMYATALAVERTHDGDLKQLLLSTADYLVGTQEENGYLGSYSPALRLTNKNNKIKNKSWDVWGMSYMTLGLLKVNEYFPDQKYLGAAKKIGELFLKTFGDGSEPVTDYGTRDGISATIILDPVVELYKITGDDRYLNFANLILKEMEEKEGVRFISAGLRNGDMESIGDGKAYQIIWNLTSLVKLYEITGNAEILKALENSWKNIVDYHLTIAGGPWGGIGKHYECFNKKGYWDPYGFIETCSTMSWIQFNKELLKVTGEAKYADEIEKSAYNALQGAQFPNGVDWSYHSFSNGRRHVAHFNDCCPSSGAMALEELPPLIYSVKENGIACNLFTESTATIPLKGNEVTISQHTEYPFAGNIKINISATKKSGFPIYIRIPGWAKTAGIRINGKDVKTDDIISGTYFKIDRVWNKNDVIDVSFPFDLEMHQKSESAKVPQGKADIYRITWFALSKGPLIYSSNGLIGGENREMVYSISPKEVSDIFKPVDVPANMKGNAYQLVVAGQPPLMFVPYYEADGRQAGTWRLTWIENNIGE